MCDLFDLCVCGVCCSVCYVFDVCVGWSLCDVFDLYVCFVV